jgi:hypothetical protein
VLSSTFSGAPEKDATQKDAGVSKDVRHKEACARNDALKAEDTPQ